MPRTQDGLWGNNSNYNSEDTIGDDYGTCAYTHTHTHNHTHTHTHTHARTHTHTHTAICAHLPTSGAPTASNACTDRQTDTHTHTYKHTQTAIIARAPTCGAPTASKASIRAFKPPIDENSFCREENTFCRVRQGSSTGAQISGFGSTKSGRYV